MALIKYNLSYYAKTLKYIAPIIAFVIFFAFFYNQRGVPIWETFYITSIAIFVVSSWISTSFVNAEDKTQQYITKTHVKSENKYHILKIASILVFMVPFYALLIAYPMALGFFARNLAIGEVIVVVIIHFLASLSGVAIGLFFNQDMHGDKSMMIPWQLTVTLVVAVPFERIFSENIFVRIAAYALPPLNFLGERMNALGDGSFAIDGNFLLFAVYSLGYSLVLVGVYVLMIRKRSKR
ncbi:MAG: hypothetical protein FWC69_00280 [Defluviitaleaceae bacterium]|nr:hypothetical protein [Defluviitaleaceae bacterium]